MPERIVPDYEVFVNDPIPLADRLPTGETMMWSPIASTLIFGASDAVLVDPPFTREQTERVGDWVQRSGKRLTHIYITHGHGDHWFGAARLVERFPGATVYATAGTIALMHESTTQRKLFWDTVFPGQIGETPVTAQPVPAAGFTLEGHRLHAVEVGHSDGDNSTVLHVPSIGLVVAGDVAYNGVHQYLAEGAGGGLEAWLRAVEHIRRLRPRAVVAGHKARERADDPRVLDETADYLRTALRLLSEKPSAQTFFDAMVASFPDRLNPSAVWLSATRLLTDPLTNTQDIPH
ncbi:MULTISPECIES: MBL fold metallo-hydrolase [unclassified Nocardia]|uniref:MBL fold metallo-hydrolase n=1 Tax=unclassified Nocardia TaxID=2637762 RepID=UPI001CE49A5F|nr:MULTISPECIES: MBL fold metallo-hydrolase [unclassified Nocardia]